MRFDRSRRRIRLAGIEHVGVPLAPRRVGDLRDHGVERPRGRVAEQEAHRVEADPQVARVGEQPDGAGGAAPEPLGDQAARRIARAARPRR